MRQTVDAGAAINAPVHLLLVRPIYRALCRCPLVTICGYNSLIQKSRTCFVTLIVSITSSKSIWLLADRRLSKKGQPPKDDGRKIMFLETSDGFGILGYAGLGATAIGTEPADWMSAVLRGRDRPLEESLGILAAVIERELPRHIMPVRGGPAAHYVMVPAFVGEQPRFYSISLVLARDGKSRRFQYTRHFVRYPSTAPPRTPQFGLGGSGALYLTQDPDWARWKRNLLRLVRANERGRVSPYVVADELAKLNNKVCLSMTDKSVGPRCIVAWRYRKGDVKYNGGHQSYMDVQRDTDLLSLPSIAHGTDWDAVTRALWPHAIKMLESTRIGGSPPPQLDVGAINAVLARIQENPDENLR
jgi:hypothetical protein